MTRNSLKQELRRIQQELFRANKEGRAPVITRELYPLYCASKDRDKKTGPVEIVQPRITEIVQPRVENIVTPNFTEVKLAQPKLKSKEQPQKMSPARSLLQAQLAGSLHSFKAKSEMMLATVRRTSTGMRELETMTPVERTSTKEKIERHLETTIARAGELGTDLDNVMGLIVKQAVAAGVSLTTIINSVTSHYTAAAASIGDELAQKLKKKH